MGVPVFRSSSTTTEGLLVVLGETANVVQGRQLRARSLLPGQLQEALHSIGIWFKKTSKQTVVWVANRERPVLEPSASRFALSDRGELVLLATPSNTLLWSSNATSPSPRTTAAPATLQDDGNLVTWQSFDHPTDTWLP